MLLKDPTHPPRILVVDDDPEMVDLVQRILEEARCTITPAYSGEEAWKKLLIAARRASEEFDLVVLDVMMPGMDGYELCARIKEHETLRFTPVLMMTALASVDDKTLGLGVGADDYITKPFDPRELLARVGAMLRIRFVEQELRRRNQELAVLNEISRAVTSSLDLEQILAQTMQGIRKILPVEAGALMLLDEVTGELILHRTLDPGQNSLPLSLLEEGQPLVEQVVREGRPLVVNDFSLEERVVEGCPCSLLCVPLTVKGRVIGVLELVNKREGPFDENDQALLSSMAASVATAIENARLYQELAESARELERSQAQLIQAEKMAATGRLAASIAHEINNPLQAIHNSLHLIMRPNLSPEKRYRYLMMAQEEVERLIDIVRRMLEFYRPSRGRVVPTDVNKVVENVLVLTNKRLQHGRIRVHADLDPNLPRLPAVPDQLTQVFLNIVINAIEAMPDGGDLWIRTCCSEDGEWVLTHFTDTGPGLDETAIANIFEPFYTTKSTGTGLGLSISYGIIERHGGRIEVESRPGEGATFTVRLPVERP